MGTASKFLMVFVSLTQIASTHTLAPSTEERLNHAIEVLGQKQYQNLKVSQTASIRDLSLFIEKTAHNNLKQKYKNQAQSITQAILSASSEYGFDPLFLMAVIQNESSFNPEMIGRFGEIGLMQIKPSTARWIAQEMKLTFKGANSLKNPSINIRLGAAFFAMLREKFNQNSNLYLSAYNMGEFRVKRLTQKGQTPRVYAQAVMKRYRALYTGLTSQGTLHERADLASRSLASVTK